MAPAQPELKKVSLNLFGVAQLSDPSPVSDQPKALRLAA
jgi:hypothetical protein